LITTRTFLRRPQAAFFIKTEGGINRILLSEDGNEDGMGFYFYRRLSPDQKWSVPLYSACRLNDQTLRALAEAPAQRPADDPYAWDHRPDTYLTEVKRFLFNVLLFLGSLPEEYEPDQVLRAAREKKGHLRPELRAARFLAKEAYRPASRPTGAEHQPTGVLAQQRYAKSHRILANCRGVKDFRRFRNSQDGTWFSRSVLGA
jgi:hypothetical protein